MPIDLPKYTPKHNVAFRHIFKLYLSLWAILIIASIALVINDDLNRAVSTFEQSNERFIDHVTERMLVAETALEGFSAYISQTKIINHKELGLVASNLLERYPFLYMFEVAERIEHNKREKTENDLKRIYPEFYIRHFDFEVTREWIPANVSETYYPITFQEPYYSDKANIIGLDLYFSGVLQEAMKKSYKHRIPIATRPFMLAEDEPGYVIHRAINEEVTAGDKPLTAQKYTLLAIKSESFFSHLNSTPENYSIEIKHGGFKLPNDDFPVVLEETIPRENTFGGSFFPKLLFQKNLSEITPSQPFIILTEWQLSASEFSYIAVIIILILSFFIPFVGKNIAFQYAGKQLNDMESDGSLYYLANFDELTGIPNRHRLLEHIEMMILRAKRDNTKFTIFFIDLDNLKILNDFHGHAAGDYVLNEICTRIGHRVRQHEMLARLGGDEFVLVSNIYSDHKSEQEVEIINRIKQQFTSPISYRKEHFMVTLSVGSATYPDDGKNLNALLECADERMYVDKKKSKKRNT